MGDAEQGPLRSSPAAVDVNDVMSYNVRAIRRQRGWTQQQVADRLGELTCRQPSTASLSALERGCETTRRTCFGPHELYVLSVAFGVPAAYFVLPPPDRDGAVLADTGQPVADLCGAAFGTDDQVVAVDERLAAIRMSRQDDPDRAMAIGLGPDGIGIWRRHRLGGLRRVDIDRPDEVVARIEGVVGSMEGRRCRIDGRSAAT